MSLLPNQSNVHNTVASMTNTIRNWLTRVYALPRGGVTEVSRQSVHDITWTVYWYDDESDRLGDASPLGTVLLNERLRHDFTKGVKEYVFLHEVGHQRIGFPWRQFSWPAYVVTVLLFVAGVLSLPRTTILAISHASSWVEYPLFLSIAVGITLGCTIPVVTLSWLDEATADLFAISILGREQYETVRCEMSEERDDGVMHSVRLRIQYPPQSLVLWYARKRGIGDPPPR